jgi:uncharacterized membrane protein
MNNDDIDLYNSYFWKLGLFYYNPDNPRIFVPKRIGIGWTLNFAKWQAKVFVAVIMLLLIITLFFKRII